jgi:DNA-binding SARP family transcriptional activator
VLFHVLGPVEVHTGTACRLGAGKEARMLITLLPQPNAWVTVDQPIGGTWPQPDMPASVGANPRTYGWRLRRLLPDGGARIERQPIGGTPS